MSDGDSGRAEFVLVQIGSRVKKDEVITMTGGVG